MRPLDAEMTIDVPTLARVNEGEVRPNTGFRQRVRELGDVTVEEIKERLEYCQTQVTYRWVPGGTEGTAIVHSHPLAGTSLEEILGNRG